MLLDSIDREIVVAAKAARRVLAEGWLRPKPVISPVENKFVVVQFGVSLIDPINLILLSGAQAFVGV